MSINLVAHGNMKHEESTIHSVNGKRCGDIVRAQVSRMEESMEHRVYECGGCKRKWKFGAS